MDLDALKQLFEDLDPAEILPEIEPLLEKIQPIVRVAVMLGPVILLVMGLTYLLVAPREANHLFGYRCYFGMGSVEAWKFTQRLSGIVLGGLGLILTVVMVLISRNFAAMEAEAMFFASFKCLLWEAGLALAAILAINITAAIRFDRKGNRRFQK